MSESTVPLNPAGRVFLSYASRDVAVAQQVCAALETSGQRCWIAPRDVHAGESYAAAIVEAINSCRMLVLLLSGNSIDSAHVLREVERASSKKRPVLTVRLDGSALPPELEYFLSANQWLDASGGRIESIIPELVAAVSSQSATAHAAPVADAARSGSHSFPVRKRGANRAYIALGAVVALGAAYALAQRFWPATLAHPATPAAPAPVAGSAPVAAAAQPVAPRTAIAVMPFTNLTGDASKEYLGDGMAEELINTLSKVEGLKVPARTSTFAYKGRNTDIRQIGRDLNVGTILEGSVRTAGKRIRITAQLINAQDGLHLWSETYDEQFTDIFMLQDKLATQIAKALQPNLSDAAQAAVAQAPPTQDVEAYRLYLQGVALNGRGLQADTAGRAVEAFNQAIARDPKFARAYVGLASAHGNLVTVGDPVTRDEHQAASRKALMQALALDPNQAQAHIIQARLSSSSIARETEYRTAIQLDPNDASMRVAYSTHLAWLGHLREALEEGRKAQALLPASAGDAASIAELASMAGQDAEARKYATLALDLGWVKDSGPLKGMAIRTALLENRLADVPGIFDASLSQAFADPERLRQEAALKRIYVALADPARRTAAIAMRTELYPRRRFVGYTDTTNCSAVVSGYVVTGALDAAFDLANKCRDQTPDATPASNLALSKIFSPEMRAFRRDPRFQAYAARFIDALAYWQKFGPPDDCDLAAGKLTCH